MNGELEKYAEARVCHMIRSLRIGGAERQVVNLLNALPSEQAVLITLGKDIGPLADELSSGVQIESMMTRWRSLPFDIWRLTRILRKSGIDVLQTHMYWANFVGAIAGKLAGIAVIVTTEHGKNERKPGWARWTERHLISRLVDMRICVSEDIRRVRNLKDGVPIEKLCVVSNGTPVQAPKQLRNNTPVTVGTLGRLVEAKDLSTLIKAAALLREQQWSMRVVIVGDGPSYSELVNEVKSRQLEEVVELSGFSSDTAAWLDTFDIYVISSVREGQPLSLLEAMAIGLPIVATNVGGIPYTVEDGREAILVPPGDAPALAGAIGRLAADLPLRQRLGAAARERLMKEFSVTTSLKRHLDLYASVRASKESS